jgi:hypothetical protein
VGAQEGEKNSAGALLVRRGIDARCSESDVKPTRSANSTETIFRSTAFSTLIGRLSVLL